MHVLRRQPVNVRVMATIGGIRMGDLVHHWVRHHRSLGADSIEVVFHNHPAVRETENVSYKRAILEAGALIVREWDGEWDPARKRTEMEAALRAGPETDWAAFSDVDEFPDFGGDYRTLAAYCQNRHYDHVTGFFVDHVTRDGSLPAIHRDIPVFGQFPLTLPITRNVALAEISKVCLFRPHLAVSQGHHRVEGGGNQADVVARIHHFKFDVTLQQRLMLRNVETYPWHSESRRLLDLIGKDGKLDLSKVAP
jgi:hypothetical protein